MQRRAARAAIKDEPESAYGRKTTLDRTSRDQFLNQFRRARRRLGATRR